MFLYTFFPLHKSNFPTQYYTSTLHHVMLTLQNNLLVNILYELIITIKKKKAQNHMGYMSS